MSRPILGRLWKFFRNAVAVVCGLVIVIVLLPSKARSQLGLDPCGPQCIPITSPA